MEKLTQYIKGFCLTSIALLTQFNPAQVVASGLSCCCEMPCVTVYADFIYWQTTQDGLDFARTGQVVTEGVGDGLTSIPTGAIYDPDCHWSPGFRVGAFVDLNCCGVDFYAQYTWLHDHRPKVAGFGGNLTPTWNTLLNPIPVNGIFRAEARTDSHYNILDFGLGRTFNVNCCFQMRPHFGFKTTWQEYKYDILYTTTNPFPSGATATRIRNKMDFNGIGLRSGLDLTWKMRCGFSLIGNMALSAVYSDINVYRQDSFEIVTPFGTVLNSTIFAKEKAHHCALVPVVELLVGARYDTTVCDCYDFFLFFGWEEQVWFNTEHFIRNTPDSNKTGGNTMMQGIVLRSGVGF